MNISYSACWILPVPSWQPLTWSQTSFVQEHSNWQSPPYDGKEHGVVQLMPENPFSHAVNEIIKNADSQQCSLLTGSLRKKMSSFVVYFSNKYLMLHYCNMLWTVGDFTIFFPFTRGLYKIEINDIRNLHVNLHWPSDLFLDKFVVFLGQLRTVPNMEPLNMLR